MNTWFLTGATGAVGSAVAGELLRRGDLRLWLLLRADSEEHLQTRLQSLLRFWQLDAARDDARGYDIRVLRGDACAPGFGLSRPQREELARSCTHLVHAAGAVRMNLPIAAARRSAVDSAEQVLALARDAKRLQKVEMVSTVGVGGRYPGPVPETWIDREVAYHNTYEQAKAEAEVLMRRAVEEGLPLTVHRPSMVVGDSETGRIIHYQVFYHLCEFLSGRRTFGLMPRFGDAQLDTVPVDYVAKAICHSGTVEAAASGRILHLCSGPDLAVTLEALSRRVRTRFSEYGLAVPARLPLPTAMFRTLVAAGTVFMKEADRRAARTLPVFLEYLAESQAFGNSASRSLLESGGLGLPRPDGYLDTVVNRYLASKGAAS